MSYVIEFHFDERTEAGVKKIWADLAALAFHTPASNHGASPGVPFLTFVNVDVARLRNEFKLFASKTAPFEASFSGVADHNSRISMMVRTTPELVACHSNLFGLLKKMIQSPRPDTMPGNWSPHCVVADPGGPAHMVKAYPLLSQIPFPIPFTFSSMSLVQSNNVRTAVIYECPLGGGKLLDRSSNV